MRNTTSEEDERDQCDGERDELGQIIACETTRQSRDRDDAGGQHAVPGEETGERAVSQVRIVLGTAGPRVFRGQLGVRGGCQQSQTQGRRQRHPDSAP